jgi:glycosyltransferase involved in cell wall biosynthesis
MNILELCLSPGLGGLELYVYRSSDALSRKNNVIAVLAENDKLDNYYKEHSSTERLYLKRSRNPVPLINAKKLAKIIDDYNIDAIHMHWGKDLALAAFAKAFSRKKPSIVYTRQMMITRPKNDFYHNFLYGQMDIMLTITRELELLAQSFIRRYANNITTLYYGVKSPNKQLDQETIKQQRKELGFHEDAFIVGLIGRLEESKGQHLLINAIKAAKQKDHDIDGLIVGHEMNTGYRDELKSLATELEVSEKIKFQDFVNDPQQLMQLCDCIVLASGQETFGLVLAEAMRAGVAVIGSNSGGVPEIITHEQTGLLFETMNADSLYKQIERLYLDASLKNKLAQQGKQAADERFNDELHFQQLEQHFESVVNKSI